MKKVNGISNPIIALAFCLSCSLVFAQSGDCPDIQQTSFTLSSNGQDVGTATNLGVAQSANAKIEVVDDNQGAFDAGQVEDVQAAAANIFAMSGDNGDQTTVNTDTADKPSAGTVQKPIIIVSMADQATLDQMCQKPGGPAPNACTTSQGAPWTGSPPKGQNIVYSHTWVLPSAVTAPTFEQMMTHEFSHGLLGNADCDGCANTIANPVVTESSPTEPTDCDDLSTKKQWCRCNLGK